MNHGTSPTQGFYVSKSEFLDLKRSLSEQTSEVARLKEQNQKLREIADFAVDAHQHSGMRYKLKTELARLAPATEESDHIEQDLEMVHPIMNCQVCGEFQGHGHECAPAPEEPVIQDSRITEPCKCGYGPHWNEWNGVCSDCGRTRRPLPKQEEMPLEKDQVIDYCRKWSDKHLADHGKETFYSRLGLLVDFATDLYRDEIQKLKEAK